MNPRVNAICLAIAVMLVLASLQVQADPNSHIAKRGITEWRFRRLLQDDMIGNSEISLVIKPKSFGLKGKVPALKFRLVHDGSETDQDINEMF